MGTHFVTFTFHSLTDTDTDSEDDLVEKEDLTSGQHNNCPHVCYLRYALHERQLWQIAD